MSQRTQRMADALQREVAQLIRDEIKDPRLTGLITVSSVKVSSDMGYADIYITVLDPQFSDTGEAELKQQTLRILNAAAAFMRGELGRRIQTRTTPRLRFHYDEVTAHGNYMAGLIAKALEDSPASPDIEQDS